MAAATQSLPQKESGIFKKIVRCYECKQYKNGLKFAKQILSNQKFADHGETLAMKGLILNCMGRKEEAYEHVRRGLKNDIKSHVCWHVFGLLQRSDKKYDEAIKCYRNALKWDKENVQILRDLSLLQIQMRDLEGFRDTRYQLLKVRPAQRSSWVGYALSYHLLKDYDMALKVMVEYRKTQNKPQKTPDYEFSEMILYEVQLMRESGQEEKALSHLEGYRQFVSDDLSYTETKAEILLNRGERAAAELLYRDLLIRNPENYSYYESLEKCLDLQSEEDRLNLYEILREEFPRSHVCKRIPLRFVTGDTFQRLLDDHLQHSLHKGVPSLFMGLKSLYNDPQKANTIGSTVLGYLDSLQHHQRFREDFDTPPEPPTAELWSLFFLAQHFDRRGDHKRAVEYIDKAISHTPTHIELYMLKSKIYKHAGDVEEAAQWMDEARTMDTADRFVNCKCVKYLLRINKIEQAIETAGLFTREGLPTLQTLDEMQCMWFQTELAHAYQRVGQLGEALVKYHEIDRHFSDIIDDQFDFHTYCMRKMTLRPYVGVLRLEDVIKEHKFYFKAALEAIDLYIHLHDNPSARSVGNQDSENQDDKDMEHLSASERRKLHRKQRKAQAKAQARAEAKALEERKENRPQGKSGDDDRKVGDELRPKLDPKALVSKENPLDEAIKFLVPLQSFCRSKVETHLSAYAIHSRRGKDGKGKFLLMLQALKRAHALDPNNPRLHTQLVDFQLRLKENPDFPPPVRMVIESTVPKLTNGRTPEQLNQEFLSHHSCSLEHLIAGAQTLYRLCHNSQEAVQAITGLSDPLKDISVKQCSRVLHLLNNATFGNCNDAALNYKSRCHELFPMATAFKPPRLQATSDPQISSVPSSASSVGCDSICSKTST